MFIIFLCPIILKQRTVQLKKGVKKVVLLFLLHPNQDADVSRDRVLQDHIEKLKQVVTPGHKDLKIPRRYQYECPWPSAQVPYLYLYLLYRHFDRPCVTLVLV